MAKLQRVQNAAARIVLDIQRPHSIDGLPYLASSP